MRVWQSKCYQACRIGECVWDGAPFPGGLGVGEIHRLPVLIPSDQELSEVSMQPIDISEDSSNSKLKEAVFRKRSITQRGILFSQKFLWERVA